VTGRWVRTMTASERLKARGYCTGPAESVPAPGEVDGDIKANCHRCGKRVTVTFRGLFVHHKPAFARAVPLQGKGGGGVSGRCHGKSEYGHRVVAAHMLACAPVLWCDQSGEVLLRPGDRTNWPDWLARLVDAAPPPPTDEEKPDGHR
jgi:hypothetical protein